MHRSFPPHRGNDWQRRIVMWMILWPCAAVASYAQANGVTLRVDFVSATAKNKAPSTQPVTVAWLTPLGANGTSQPAPEKRIFRMVQKNKQFDPHLIVVPVGSLVQFPNQDPFFHNVFSLYNGKRFDLGLYETGSERGVRFDREGVSYIFCNIHPEMGAIILALSTPYYAVSMNGAIFIPHVPPGRYTLNVWSEGATAESLTAARKQVIADANGTDLGSIVLVATPSPVVHHSNKFGEPYPPTKDSMPPGSQY
jgi:plastocyanin